MSNPVKKTVSETQLIHARTMLPSDANPAGNVHGGTVMKLIDDAAGACAIRHCRSNVVTASVDRLVFLQPVYIGNLLTLKAAVNYVGRTSLEVGVRVEAEDLRSGKVTHTSSAYLTFVALDDDNKPFEIPGLIMETEEEKRRFNDGVRRREERLRAKVKE
ncbi:MAG: acyl-CoA thioesterase [Deltaproteobacteria bacterium]|nr:MAG: acyl-CoA thioesterase [Deltaproteobacteria bacterium]